MKYGKTTFYRGFQGSGFGGIGGGGGLSLRRSF